jgi:cell division protein DivIC
VSILLKIKDNLKIIILTILFLYILINLFGGQRGLFAYIEKKEALENLQIKEKEMVKNIKNIELKNSLLSERLDYDYIDMLIRDKLMLGKKKETTYIVVDNEG